MLILRLHRDLPTEMHGGARESASDSETGKIPKDYVQ
jgi:hypothetical protein